MSLISILVLAILQGATEFLPVSSDGHLALAEHAFGIKDGGLALTVALHAGTLGCTLYYYRKDLWELLSAALRAARGLDTGADQRALLLAVIAGSIPTALIGLSMRHAVEQWAGVPLIIGFCLLLTAGCNGIVARRAGVAGIGLEGLSVRNALMIGVMQGLAVLPGFSRSGVTIATGVFLGLEKELAARFSFLLSIPAVFGAILLMSRDIADLPGSDIWKVAVGAFVSFAVGLAAIHTLIATLQRGRFGIFVWYCVGLGSATIIYSVLSAS